LSILFSHPYRIIIILWSGLCVGITIQTPSFSVHVVSSNHGWHNRIRHSPSAPLFFFHRGLIRSASRPVLVGHTNRPTAEAPLRTPTSLFPSTGSFLCHRRTNQRQFSPKQQHAQHGMSRQAACRSRSSMFWAPDESIFKYRKPRINPIGYCQSTVTTTRIGSSSLEENNVLNYHELLW